MLLAKPCTVTLPIALALTLLGPGQTPAQAPAQAGGQDGLLDRAYKKAQQAWLAKNYRMGIAWLKPLTSKLDKKRGAQELLSALHYAQGWKEIKRRRYRQAKRELVQASVFRPGEKRIWYSLGIVSQALKDKRGAEKNFEKTLRIDPVHFESLLTLAHMAYEGSNYAKAKKYLGRAAKIRPRDPAVLLLQEKCSQDQALNGEFQSFSSSNFHIRFSGGILKSSQETRKMLAYLELSHRELKKILGNAPVKRIEVVLYSKKEFSSLRGVSDWMGAFYDGKVRIPFKSWRSQREKVQQLMRHELAHAFVEDLLPGASSWIHEGFAQWYEGRRSRGRDSHFRKSPPRSSRDLRSPFAKVQDPATASVLYLQSLILVEELLTKKGSEQIRSLLALTAKGSGSYAEREDKALLQLQGVKLDAWIMALAKSRSWATPGR